MHRSCMPLSDDHQHEIRMDLGLCLGIFKSGIAVRYCELDNCVEREISSIPGKAAWFGRCFLSGRNYNPGDPRRGARDGYLLIIFYSGCTILGWLVALISAITEKTAQSKEPERW